MVARGDEDEQRGFGKVGPDVKWQWQIAFPYRNVKSNEIV